MFINNLYIMLQKNIIVPYSFIRILSSTQVYTSSYANYRQTMNQKQNFDFESDTEQISLVQKELLFQNILIKILDILCSKINKNILQYQLVKFFNFTEDELSINFKYIILYLSHYYNQYKYEGLLTGDNSLFIFREINEGNGVFFLQILECRQRKRNYISTLRNKNGVIINIFINEDIKLIQQKLREFIKQKNIIIINLLCEYQIIYQELLKQIKKRNQILVFSCTDYNFLNSQLIAHFNCQQYQIQQIKFVFSKILNKQNQFFPTITRQKLTIPYILIRNYFVNIILFFQQIYGYIIQYDFFINSILKYLQLRKIIQNKQLHIPIQIKNPHKKIIKFCAICLQKSQKIKLKHNITNASIKKSKYWKIKKIFFYCQYCCEKLNKKIYLCVKCFSEFHRQTLFLYIKHMKQQKDVLKAIQTKQN